MPQHLWRIHFLPSTGNPVLPTRSPVSDGREKAFPLLYAPSMSQAGSAVHEAESEPTEFTGNTTTLLSYARRKEHIEVWLDTALDLWKSVPHVHGLSSTFPTHT